MAPCSTVVSSSIRGSRASWVGGLLRQLNVQGKSFSPGSALVQHHMFLRSLKTTWAAFRPAAPMTPPPGTKALLRSPPERDRAGLTDGSLNLEQLPSCYLGSPNCLGSLQLLHTAGGSRQAVATLASCPTLCQPPCLDGEAVGSLAGKADV